MHSVALDFSNRSALFPLRCATAQHHQTICAVLSHSRALATFQILYTAYISYRMDLSPLETLRWLCVLMVAQFNAH